MREPRKLPPCATVLRISNPPPVFLNPAWPNSQEMMGETLDDVMDEEGDTEEQDKIVDQVLDEIGVR